MDRSKLLRICCLITLFLSFPAMAEESVEDLCEFETPKLVNDYWPVFDHDPRDDQDGKYLVLDVVVGRDGVPLAAAPVSKVSGPVKDALDYCSRKLSFTPAYACGETVEGFFRHTVSSYFVVAKSDRDKITRPPVAHFSITPFIFESMRHIAGMTGEDVIHFSLEIGEDGSIQEMKGKDKVGKFMVTDFFSKILPHMRFLPAVKDDQPMAVELDLNLLINRRVHNHSAYGVDWSESRRPMPRKPGGMEIDPDKIYSVLLDFDSQGILQNIQFLTPMNQAESLAALNAFRNWNLGASGDETALGQELVVKYAYIGDSQHADIVEEPRALVKTMPKPISRRGPEYPPELLRAGVSGYAVVVFVIDKEGKVRAPRIEFATKKEFGIAAARAVSKWKFEPAMLEGEPINITVSQPIPFTFRN